MADDLPRLKDRNVAFRASMLPIGNYEDGSIAFPVWPQGAVDAYEALGRFHRGEAPQPQDAVLAGLAMAGSGFGGLGARAAGRAVESGAARFAANPKEAAPTGMLAAANAGERQGIRAYHGSPHDFDKFSLDKVGTGEGAQAYGHGLYFAENEGVARGYRKSTSDADMLRKFQEHYSELDSPADALAEVMNSPDFAPSQKRLFQALEAEDWWGFDYPHQAIRAALREPKNFDPGPETLAAIRDLGKMYEVRINAEPEHFLAWDKPAIDQSPSVRSKLPPEWQNDIVPEYPTFQGHAQTPEGMARLREAGIPGIRYLDQRSRGDGEGTANYVVFDDNLIDIIRKYSNPPEAAPAGLLAASSLERMRAEDAVKPRPFPDAPQTMPELESYLQKNVDGNSRTRADEAWAEDPTRYNAYSHGMADVLNPESQWWKGGPTQHANGGVVLPPVSTFAHGGVVKGALHASTGGRTDVLPMHVEAGSYVVPADIVSALGEGNTAAGTAILHEMFPDTPAPAGYAAGGAVPIIAAGGEHVLTPAQVAAVGGGDINRGHEALDAWIKATRKQTIDTLRKLPGPARD